MATYLVMEPEDRPLEQSVARAILLRDGFAALAFIAPLLWFLWHRMWVEALAIFAIGLLVGGLGTLPGFAVIAALCSLLVSILVGLEARSLRAAALRRRDWRDWGVIEAGSREEAEMRYAAEAAADRPVTTPTFPVMPPPVGAKTKMPAFGLLDYPRKAR